MKRNLVKRVVAGTALTLVLLTMILAVHIYVVTRPKADAHTVALARIDIKQPITETQAANIETWLRGQNGVDHVLLNRQSNIIIFSFYPVKANATIIAQNLSSDFNIAAQRFVPSQEELKSSCPALSHNFYGKVIAFTEKIFNHN